MQLSMYMESQAGQERKEEHRPFQESEGQELPAPCRIGMDCDVLTKLYAKDAAQGLEAL